MSYHLNKKSLNHLIEFTAWNAFLKNDKYRVQIDMVLGLLLKIVWDLGIISNIWLHLQYESDNEKMPKFYPWLIVVSQWAEISEKVLEKISENPFEFHTVFL